VVVGMCGICGAVSTLHVPLAPNVARDVQAMLGALAHRGPDASNLNASAEAILGATRLAIRGLSDGLQPLNDLETGLTVVCNGEIDNHRELRTWLAERGRPAVKATDVAVIPPLYLELGAAFAEQLVGSFAIAVWDPSRERLLLVRDRVGEKPVFFRRVGGVVAFATELAALAAFGEPPLLDRSALGSYLRFGCFPAPSTPFLGCEKVGPGERVAIDPNGVRRERYWRWKRPEVAGPPPGLDELDATFRTAVERQTDVEVPCGVFLSGGIDSSLVTAVARAVRPEQPLTAFVLRFTEASYDEGIFAERVAADLKVPAVAVWVRPEDFVERLPELIRLAGEPLADPAWVPAAVLARRAATEVRTALVGEGGDELFGGYPTYTGVWLAERYRRLPASLRRWSAKAIAALPPSDKKVTLGFLLKRFIAAADLDGMERHLQWTSNLSPALIRRLGIEPPAAVSDPGLTGPLLDRVQQHDLETSLAEGLLTKADRSSMHFALELRAPFLDREVLDLAGRLDASQRVSGFRTKTFLKRYARRYLPRWVIERRKRGLSVPLASWLRGPLQGWAEAKLTGGSLADAGINVEVAGELLGEHVRRESDHARALWTLIVLAEWLDWVRAIQSAPARADTPASEPVLAS
jgi:asparagine synthase (glutamine-hydrolysing)